MLFFLTVQDAACVLYLSPVKHEDTKRIFEVQSNRWLPRRRSCRRRL
jgi:hypothetical protein